MTMILQKTNETPPLIRLLFMLNPSITDGVHRNENFMEIIPVFSSFSNFFKKKIYI